MKCLFDQNLSYRLVDELSTLFPESRHVRHVGLAGASDTEIWEYAKTKEFLIVSKDSDFHQRSLTFGAPLKVVWIQRGNCSTDEIVEVIRDHAEDIRKFAASAESAFLVLS